MEDSAEANAARAFRQQLLGERLRAQLHQWQVAERAGLTQASLSRIETGSQIPTLRVCEKLADAVDCDLIVILKPR